MKNQAVPKGKDLKSNTVLDFLSEKNEIEESRVRSLDDLTLHDDLMMGVLGGVKKDLASGLTSEEILTKYAALASARIVSIAATDADSGKALAAAKDVLDRTQGRAVERKQIDHRLSKLDEKQIDAILLSEFDKLALDESHEED